MNTRLVIAQFDEGAEHFDSWSVTRDEKMLRGLAEFCGVTQEDELLDVACGTGAFALHAATLARSVTGVDISAGMIAVARKNASERGLDNARFVHRNVENLGFEDDTFSMVVSRSAFHHMARHREVFAGMVRCCRPGGVVCIQDIMAYDEEKTDRFFERMEILVDRSHHRTYTKRDFFDLYRDSGMKLEALFESESLLDFHDYVGHVAQTSEIRRETARLLDEGLADPDIASSFVEKDGRLLWKRRVCTIKGRKIVQSRKSRGEGN
ncbi:class I SAM-dependent methyltransferase [Streptomyces prunicolor]|uniref:class I SAM-dependent methyltransferase n=1 Tax=Streptomyces prunicolor TaxID=67348 RepID=UPI0003694E21|nr:class I SAM-dependent methyltransferase [Streptomyces prunicolor]